MSQLFRIRFSYQHNVLFCFCYWMKLITFYNLISRLVFTVIEIQPYDNPITTVETVVIASDCKLFLLVCLSRRILLGSITIHESCSLIIPTSTKTADDAV